MLALGLGSASNYAPDDAAAILPLEPRQATGGGWRYLLSVGVGTPTQTLLLLLDTGSHQLLLRDAARGACGPGEPPSPPTCFNSSASTSIQERTDQENTFTYVVDVDVNLNGRYRTARDVVALGGTDAIDEAGSGAQSATRPWVALLEAASQGGIGPVERVEHFLADAAGVLGASHWPDGPWQSMLNIVSGGTDTFALDLNRGEASRLVLGGTYSAADIAWSQSQTAPDFQELLLYSPSVCGAELLGASSGWWLALIDSGSSCLGLPSNVFYGLFRWIDPSLRQCSFELHDGETSDEEAAGSGEGGASGGGASNNAYLSARRCYLPRGADAASLPTLSFRLSQTGPLLRLPLSELLLPTDADGTREFCVRSHTSSTVSGETRLIPILLGSQALHAFYADAAGRRARRPRPQAQCQHGAQRDARRAAARERLRGAADVHRPADVRRGEQRVRAAQLRRALLTQLRRGERHLRALDGLRGAGAGAARRLRGRGAHAAGVAGPAAALDHAGRRRRRRRLRTVTRRAAAAAVGGAAPTAVERARHRTSRTRLTRVCEPRECTGGRFRV